MRTRKRYSYRSAPLLALILAAGCAAATAIDSLEWPTRKPAEDDIVGTWVLAPESVKLARAKGGYGGFGTTMVFSEDGKLEIKGLPDCVRADSFRDVEKTFADHKGTWELEESQGYWGVAVRTAAEGDSAGQRFRLGLWNTQAPYRMWFGVGDPDEGNYLFFDRKGDAKSVPPAVGETAPPMEDDFSPGQFAILVVFILAILVAVVAVVAVLFLVAGRSPRSSACPWAQYSSRAGGERNRRTARPSGASAKSRES